MIEKSTVSKVFFSLRLTKFYHNPDTVSNKPRQNGGVYQVDRQLEAKGGDR